MRGAFFIIMLISLLIGCYLVIKNMDSGSEPEQTKLEAIQKAKDVTQKAKESLEKRVQDATNSFQDVSQ